MQSKFFLTATLLVLMTLPACTKIQPTPTPTLEPTATAEMANPASIFCEQNNGQLEMRSDAAGNVAGICHFADGSECDEWAYFRGECKPGDSLITTAVPSTETTQPAGQDAAGGYMAPGTSEEFSDWWGVIKSTEPGAQYDDYFERQDLGGQVINFGIDSQDPTIQSQIVALRDSGTIVHLYGRLFSNVPDYNRSQVQLNRIEY